MSDPIQEAVARFMDGLAEDDEQKPEPSHLIEIGDAARGIVALAADALEACGLDAQASSLRRCRIRLPGTPLCPIRMSNAVDTTVRMLWGGEGMLPASTRVPCLEIVCIAESVLFAITPGVTSELLPWLQQCWVRAQQIRLLVRGMTGR